ncbi:MAG: hypothetical protein JW997_00485, partial [Actinobacteria bacterium]|nr:hypothetical protein [Actinomycetota bacterium]
MEDQDGMYEAVFFPDKYDKYIKMISCSAFIIIKGRLYLKDNNVSLIANEAFSVSSFKKNEEFKKHEMLKEGFLAEIKNPWTESKKIS